RGPPSCSLSRYPSHPRTIPLPFSFGPAAVQCSFVRPRGRRSRVIIARSADETIRNPLLLLLWIREMKTAVFREGRKAVHLFARPECSELGPLV
uniref:Uncharacterized protein n=1 Tax=Anopheles albimanus TaxID=7167 RepID=A0A182FXD0_ANOAL